jgi:hypothetical protein
MWVAACSVGWPPSATSKSASKGKRRTPVGGKSASASNEAWGSCGSLRRRRRSSSARSCSLAVAINIKASGGDNVEPELPKDVKDRLGELSTLSEKVEDGDKEARRELRKARSRIRSGGHLPGLRHR